MKKNLLLVHQIGFIAFLIITNFVCLSKLVQARGELSVYRDFPMPADYTQGVNHGVDATLLLVIEQQLHQTNRTYGVMADMVCLRLNVARLPMPTPPERARTMVEINP